MRARTKFKDRQGRKQRLSITLLFTGVVMIIFLAVLLLVGIGLGLMTRLGVFGSAENPELPTLHIIIIFAAASLVVGSGLTLLLSRIPLKPINELLNFMNRLASGDFSPRILLRRPWNKYPAAVELSNSFNKMAAQLQSTEMLHNDFINNFSHEFKTPIVSIAGFARLLKKEELSPEQAEYVSIIEEESIRLSQMATNVLSLTKAENQRILTDVERINLSEQLRDCILLLSSKWEEKNIEFALEFSEHYVDGNRELLRQVWINLLDNAIKFSPRNAAVEVTAQEKEDSLEVSVKNPGDEIAPEDREKIFEKFFQTDRSRSTQGNGIGLAVAKKLVELHEGSISVKSENGMNVFSVVLPKTV